MILGTATITLPQSQAYFLVPPATPPAAGAIPSYAQTSAQGSTSVSGIEKSVTEASSPVRRNVPAVDMTLNSPVNAFRVQDAAAAIEASRRFGPIDYKQRFGGRFLAEQGRQLNRIYTSLLDLRQQASAIQSSSAYNIKSAASADAAVATASAGQNTPVGKYAVTVTQLAKEQQLASTAMTDPGAALGLTGTFKLNGWQIAVAASDSLVSIRDKINYGEDANHNGRLDYPADLNGNGALDTLSSPGTWNGRQYLPSFYWNEQQVGQGSLTGNEDTNGNQRLDGTPSQTGVKAAISGGQLVLQSLNGGAIELRMDDASGVLESIGVLYRNPDNNDVVPNIYNDQTIAAQSSAFSVNGTANTAATNTVTNGVGGLMLQLNAAGGTTVSVTADPAQALGPLAAFSDSYNRALGLLNATLGSSGGLASNVRLQDIYTDAVRSFYTAPGAPVGGYASVADVGVNGQSPPGGIPELALSQVASGGGLATTAPQAYAVEAGRMKVGGANDFKITLDTAELDKQLTRNNAGVKDIMALAAGRLQQKLDRHLQPDYGTIRMQQGVFASYSQNQQEVSKLMAQSAQLPAGALVGRQNILFTPLEGQRNNFNAVA